MLHPSEMPSSFGPLHSFGKQGGVFLHRLGERFYVSAEVLFDGCGLQALQSFRAGVRIGELGAFHDLVAGDEGIDRALAVVQRCSL
jgi:hypothetical protein